MGQNCFFCVAARIPSHIEDFPQKKPVERASLLTNLESNQDFQNQNLT